MIPAAASMMSKSSRPSKIQEVVWLVTANTDGCNASEYDVVYIRTTDTVVPGVVLYSDSGLTSPVTGRDYVKDFSGLDVYEIDSVTGVIGADTGFDCNIA